MALSQKHQGKILVPWFNSDEWRMVYGLIYSESSTTVEHARALKILMLWKARMPLLFSGVEGTLIILDAILLDESTIPGRALCSLYATAIMRFLNICAANSDRQGTFYNTAKEKNLPDWLINIRHDMAHSQKLPSKFMLELGLKYCLSWLQSEYWELQNNVIEDYVIDKSAHEQTIKEAIYLYRKVVKKCLYKREFTEELAVEIRRLGVTVGKNMSLINIQKNLLNLIFRHSILKDYDKIIDFIIDDGGIFHIPGNFEENEKCLHMPKDVVKSWEPLMQYMYEHRVLIYFIQKLFCITYDEAFEDAVKEVASLWLNEIFKGLIKEKLTFEKISSLDTEDAELDKRTFIAAVKSIIESDYPFLSKSLNFMTNDLSYTSKLYEIKKQTLDKPNVYTEKYLQCLLQLCECQGDFIADVNLAVKSFMHVNNTVVSLNNDQLHTLNDALSVIRQDLSGCQEITFETPDTIRNIDGETTSTVNTRKWQKVEDTWLYNGCPLGILPHQDRNLNPIMDYL